MYTVWYNIDGCTSPCLFVSGVPSEELAWVIARAYMARDKRVYEVWVDTDY
jgi:hypothetical protein